MKYNILLNSKYVCKHLKSSWAFSRPSCSARSDLYTYPILSIILYYITFLARKTYTFGIRRVFEKVFYLEIRDQTLIETLLVACFEADIIAYNYCSRNYFSFRNPRKRVHSDVYDIVDKRLQWHTIRNCQLVLQLICTCRVGNGYA